jgi:hypothetical protein
VDHLEVGVVKDIGGSGWGHGTSLDDAVKIKNICGSFFINQPQRELLQFSPCFFFNIGNKNQKNGSSHPQV